MYVLSFLYATQANVTLKDFRKDIDTILYH